MLVRCDNLIVNVNHVMGTYFQPASGHANARLALTFMGGIQIEVHGTEAERAWGHFKHLSALDAAGALDDDIDDELYLDRFAAEELFSGVAVGSAKEASLSREGKDGKDVT